MSFGLVLLALTAFWVGGSPAPNLDDTSLSGEPQKIGQSSGLPIHFSQPMLKGSVEKAIRIEPNLSGEWSWSNSSTIEYRSEKPMKIGDQYSVTVKRTARGIFGKKLESDIHLEFVVTGPPTVLMVAPLGDEAPRISETQPITVMFDRPMDLSQKKESELLEITPPVKGRISFLGTSAFQFTPDKWPIDQTFELKVPAGLKSAGGDKTLDDTKWNVRTPGLRAIASLPEQDGEIGTEDSLRIMFNRSVDLSQVRPGENAMLFPSNDLDADSNPKEDGFFNAEIVYGEDEDGTKDESVLVFSPSFPYQPDTEYRFVLSAGFSGMEEAFEVNFRTGEKRNAQPTNGSKISWSTSGDSLHFLDIKENPSWLLETGGERTLNLRACKLTPKDFMENNEGQQWDSFPCEEEAKALRFPEGDGPASLSMSDFFGGEWEKGIYFLSVAPPSDQERAYKLVVVSDMTLFLKKSDREALVWAVRRETGEPLGNVNLEFFDYSGERVLSGKTDSKGLYKVRDKLSEGIYVTGAESGSWGMTHEFWSQAGGSIPNAGDNAPAVYLISSANVVKAGEEFEMKGIWRTQKGSLLTLPEGQTHVTVKLEGKQSILAEESIPIRRNGSFDTSLLVPMESTPGDYQLNVYDPEGYPLDHPPMGITVVGHIAPFLLEWLNPNQSQIEGAFPEFTLQASYGNGFPATNLDGGWQLFRQSSPFPISSGELEFNIKGQATISIREFGGEKGFLPSGDYLLSASANNHRTDAVNRLLPFSIEQGSHRSQLTVKHHFLSPGQEVEIQVAHTKSDGSPLLDPPTVIQLSSADGKVWLKENVDVKSALSAFLLELPSDIPQGKYTMSAESRDESGRIIRAQEEVYVLDRQRNALMNELSILSDQPDYLVGGKAQLLINHPLASAQNPIPTLVTYERDDFLEYQYLLLQTQLTPLELPLKKEMSPEILVSALALGSTGMESAYSRVRVGQPSSDIKVELSVDPISPQAGDEVKVSIKTSDYQNRPVRAVVTLNVNSGTLPPLSPSQYFLERKGSVGEVSLFRSIHFDPLVLTDQQGHAETSFILPEGLSEKWRVNAIATSGTDQFGWANSPLSLRQRLEIRPITPSFITPGDEAFISANVRNLSDENVSANIELLSPHLNIKGGEKRSLSLKPAQSTTVYWEVSAPDLEDRGSIKLAFRSREDYVEKTLSVKKLHGQRNFILRGGDQSDAVISVIESAFEDMGSLKLSLGSGPKNLSDLYRVMAQRMNYPMTEALALKLMALNMEERGKDVLRDIDLRDFSQEIINELTERQGSDGGLSPWLPEEASSASASSYALMALSSAKELGLEVDGDLLTRMSHFLWEAVDDEDEPLSTRTLALFCLSESEQHDTERSIELLGERESMDMASKSMLLMVVENLIGAGQQSMVAYRDRLLSELVSDGVSGPMALLALSRMEGENTALEQLLDDLTQPYPSTLANGPLEALLRSMAFLGASDLLTSSANIIAKVSLDGKPVLDASLGSTEEIHSKQIPIRELGDLSQPHHIHLDKSGEGDAFLGGSLIYYPQGKNLESVEKGAIIHHSYWETEGGLPATRMQQGKLYKGEIKLIVSKDMSRAVLESPLPAGVKALNLMPELENPLYRYQQEETDQMKGLSWTENPVWHFEGHEISDDRILLYAEELPAGSYTIRYTAQAGLPGSFSKNPTTLRSLGDDDIFAQSKGGMIEVVE